MKVAENALQFGHTLLVEDVGEALPAWLDPVLRNRDAILRSHVPVAFAGASIDCSEQFRYACTAAAASRRPPTDLDAAARGHSSA